MNTSSNTQKTVHSTNSLTSETTNHYSIFLGGLPATSSKTQILTSIRKTFKGRPLRSTWKLELKGKKGKNGHLGFGFIHFLDKVDKLNVLSMLQKVKKNQNHQEIEGFEKSSLVILGKKIEVKNAWSIEQHKTITDVDRKKKVYVSCLRKSVKRRK